MRIEIKRNYTATDAEPEQRLAFFREDIGINAHHWHWHLGTTKDFSFYHKMELNFHS